MNEKIELIHFQLTKNCNLRCWFCGQWGKKGFFSDFEGDAMTLSDWGKVISEIKRFSPLPDIMLWGGEPLIYSEFEKIVDILKSEGFHMGIVTNGVMIDRYVNILKNDFCHIYVSLDGTPEIHNRIRGEGIYEKVSTNLELLRGTKAKISIMSVLSEDNIFHLQDTVKALSDLNCDEIILQDIIAFSKEDVKQYKDEMRKIGIDAEYIDSWIMENPPVCNKKLIDDICKKQQCHIKYLPHGEGNPCNSPNSHIHIAWNGDLMFCTDFYDFSAGNVKNDRIMNIFNNEKSQAFRKLISEKKLPTCRHCSWRHSVSFRL